MHFQDAGHEPHTVGMWSYPKVSSMLLSGSPPDSPPAKTAEALRWEGEGLSNSEPDI
jgi:hypothetical protein